MTKEERQILLKDLCMRLPYGVKVKSSRRQMVLTLSLDIMTDFHLGCTVKPYLRPMSSMTEEEKNELCELCDFKQSYDDRDYFSHYGVEVISEYCCNGERIPESVINYNVIDFFHAHHLDWRGLIPEGLALEAPKGMYNN